MFHDYCVQVCTKNGLAHKVHLSNRTAYGGLSRHTVYMVEKLANVRLMATPLPVSCAGYRPIPALVAFDDRRLSLDFQLFPAHVKPGRCRGSSNCSLCIYELLQAAHVKHGDLRCDHFRWVQSPVQPKHAGGRGTALLLSDFDSASTYQRRSNGIESPEEAHMAKMVNFRIEESRAKMDQVRMRRTQRLSWQGIGWVNGTGVRITAPWGAHPDGTPTLQESFAFARENGRSNFTQFAAFVDLCAARRIQGYDSNADVDAPPPSCSLGAELAAAAAATSPPPLTSSSPPALPSSSPPALPSSSPPALPSSTPSPQTASADIGAIFGGIIGGILGLLLLVTLGVFARKQLGKKKASTAPESARVSSAADSPETRMCPRAPPRMACAYCTQGS